MERKGKKLLVEVGMEEAPAWFLDNVRTNLSSIVEEFLKREKLSFEKIYVTTTPRRIVLIISGLAEKQPDETIQVIGPSANVSIGKSGEFLPPAIKFAEKQGGTIDDLLIVETEKGKYVALRKTKKGSLAEEVISKIIPEIFTEKTIPHQKSMRWGESSGPFVRPIHWLVVLLDEKVVPCEIFGIKSGRLSRGHRFHHPEPVELSSPENYENIMQDCMVIVSHEKRKKFIHEEIRRIANSIRGEIVDNPELEDEVTNLVEFPVVVLGKFNEKFLELPQEVIKVVMAKHQRYFAVKSKTGDELLPYFIAVANTDPALKGSIIEKEGGGSSTELRKQMIDGFAKVLSARLEDAVYFFKEDRKKKLEEKLNLLEGIVFQKGAGSYLKKARRIEKLAETVAGEMKLNKEDIENCKKAALLCKADLTTNMVFEFSELQGIMGGIYAKLDGENENIVRGISEHYLPSSTNDPLPSSITGIVCSIADKIDSLITFSALGHRPTSSSDPLGFRRLSLGLIRIILEKNIRLNLNSLWNLALNLVKGDIDKEFLPKIGDSVKPVEFINEFLKERLKVAWKDELRADFIDAVLEVESGTHDLIKARKRLDAIKRFKESPYFENLAVAFKRAFRICREVDIKSDEINPVLFTEKEEKDLYDEVKNVKSEIERAYLEEDFDTVFTHFSKLRPVIDAYFEKVFVNVEDEKIRKNRLATMKLIVELIEKAGRLDLIQFERTKL